MRSNALKVGEHDNVVIATQVISKGDPVVVHGEQLFKAAEAIAPGHKIALVPLAPGESVLRYGEPIVQVTQPIGQGGWVHVHNTQPILSDHS